MDKKYPQLSNLLIIFDSFEHVALYMNYENKPVYRYNVPTLVPYCDREFQEEKCQEINEKWEAL